MTTEKLYAIASNAVYMALEDVLDGSGDIAEAVLEAVEFDALLKERKAMREALRWYGDQANQMGTAAVGEDRQTMLKLMEVIATDSGARAKSAMKEQAS